jgi:AbrB family looped-hinge helix DNA binding protein
MEAKHKMKTVVDEAGRIQLPDDVRAQLGLKAGDEVALEERAGEWVLKAAKSGAGLCWEGNVLVHKGSTPANGEVDDPVGHAREERFRELSQGMP